jgi:ketosteroid isomerase-like protein
MSQENVEIVRRVFEVFNQGGPTAVWRGGFWSTEIVWDTTPSGIPGLGIYRGYEEVKSAFEDDWFKAFPFEEWELVVEELIDHGDQVIAMSRQRGRGASSGVAAELKQAHVVTVRGGQVVRFVSYLDRKKALEAVGLSE